jgi:hypothetical protein
MSSTAPAASVVPADVAAFAAEHGGAEFIHPLLEMTHHLFPAVPLTLRLEDDMEIPDLRWIVFDIDVVGLEVDQLVAGQQQWSRALFQHCPATHAHLFVLGMWASA